MKVSQKITVREVTYIAGKEFNLVNPLPEPVMEKLMEVVVSFEEEKRSNSVISPFSKLDAILDFISGGYCGRVYDMGDYILKVNKPNHSYNLRDGQIMHELQGVPCIPKLFIYSEDNRYMIVEKIKGMTVSGMGWEASPVTPEEWDLKKQEERLELSHGMIQERGWVMADCHGDNCMVDEEGNFWLIDVGLFSKHTEHTFGRGYDCAQDSLRKADEGVRYEEVEKEREERRAKRRAERAKERHQNRIKRIIEGKKENKHFARALLDSRATPLAPEPPSTIQRILASPFKQHQPNIGIDVREAQAFAQRAIQYNSYYSFNSYF
jgi:tRNA A-37 threonylcarbamoyl transferase component Bud32